MNEEKTKRPRAGRPPAPVPPGRDLPTELAHLRAWWTAKVADLPPLSRLAARAGLSQQVVHRVVKAATLDPTAAWLDKLYPVLAAAGYQPLSTDYLFP